MLRAKLGEIDFKQTPRLRVCTLLIMNYVKYLVGTGQGDMKKHERDIALRLGIRAGIDIHQRGLEFTRWGQGKNADRATNGDKITAILCKHLSCFFEDIIVLSNLCKEMKACTTKTFCFPPVPTKETKG